MSPIFKPTPISWEDIAGGFGEDLVKEIENFTWENCYPDEPIQWDSDEELSADLAFFAETWNKLGGNQNEKAETTQTAAVLALIEGAFFDSMAYEKIINVLVRSATKHRLVEIVTHVASAYCQYIALKARIEIAEAQAKMDGKA